MSKIGNAALSSFQEELAKMAAPSTILGTGGALGGLGVGVGGILGAGIGGVRKYQQAREEGGTRLQAMGAGLSGAYSGGTTGALAGGALGMAGGSALGHLAPETGNAIVKNLNAREGIPGAFARFGQRQVHGLTGYAEGHLGDIRHGAWASRRAEEAARAELSAARAGTSQPGLIASGVNKVLGRTHVEAAKSNLAKAVNARKVSEEVERMGMTSVPGYLRSMKQNGVGTTLGTAAKDFWSNADPLTKAMAVGSGYGVVSEAMKDENPMYPGEGRLSRTARRAADVAAFGLTSPLPMGTQNLISYGLRQLPTKDSYRGRLLEPLSQDLSAMSGQNATSSAGSVGGPS